MQKDLDGNPRDQMHIKMTTAGSRGRREVRLLRMEDVFGDLSGLNFLGENIKNTPQPGQCDVQCALAHGHTEALLLY